jgi:protein ImuA
MDNQITALKERIQRLERTGPKSAVSALPFNCPSIDGHLPDGGLPLGVLHEVSAAPGIFHETAATLFIAGVLARMSGPVLWCVKTSDLFAAGLSSVGLDVERIIFAETGNDKSVLITMEEGLRHNALAAVVGEVNRLPMIAARRLHLAARSSGVTCFALYRQSRYRQEEVTEPTAAFSRWRINSMPSDPLPVAGLGQTYWKIELTRCRDTHAAIWTLGGCNEKGYLGLASHMADRPIEDHQFRVRVR